jgi:hypothetical protein
MGGQILFAHQVGRQQDELNGPRLEALPIKSLSTTPATRIQSLYMPGK